MTTINEPLPSSDFEKEINELKAKVDKLETSKPLLKNYPFILSLVAFLFTASLSIYTLRANKDEKNKLTYSSEVSGIVNDIEALKSYDKEYYEQQANNALDNNTKGVLSGIYFSKVNQLTDAISRKLTSGIYKDIEPTVLNDFARYLQLIGKIEEAIKVNNIALDKCAEKYTRVTIMRSLGNLYSIPGDSQNVEKSRHNRMEALAITKSYFGEYSTFNTMQSFVLWANDEYLNLSNKPFANTLLDSAMKYAEKLQEYNPQKYESIKQIRAAYNYYNDVLNINFGAGSWSIFRDNDLIGVAHISFLNNSYFINIDIKQGSILKKEISGSGNFVAGNKLKFMGSSSFVDKIAYGLNIQMIPQQRMMTLEMEILKNKFIKAKYYELEMSPETWELTFVRNF